MKNSMKKTLSGATSAAMFLTGAAAQVSAEEIVLTNDYGVQVTEAESAQYSAVANVKGTFSFDQHELTPADDLFNIFGTVVTGMCAKPAFATENDKADFYVNVKGKIAKSYSANLKDLREEEQILLCSCATGPATGNVAITGVKLSEVLSLAEIDEDVNAVIVRGSDGYGIPMPLSYLLEKEAMIAYKVNGQDMPSGTQLWVPYTVAKYFTRDVVDVELVSMDEIPEIEERDASLKAEVAIMNYVDGETFTLGEEITFEGYADDCGDAIAAVEFSMDCGETWTSCETPNASAAQWVYWKFSHMPESAGTYKLMVQAKTVSGNVSPLASSVVFTVE